MRVLAFIALLFCATAAHADLTIAARVHSAVAAVCPIQGVSIGEIADKSTWRIDFAKTATTAQQKAARDVVAAFDTTPPPPEPTIEEKIKTLEDEVKALKAPKETVK